MAISSSPGRFAGMKVICDDEMMSEIIEDYSRCRSASRAKRRWRRRGIKGRIWFRKVPKQHGYYLKHKNMLVVHSAIYKLIKEQASATQPYFR